MRHTFTKLVLLFTVILAISACSHGPVPVHNVVQNTVPAEVQQKYTTVQVGDIITRAAVSKDWVPDHKSPGTLHATYKWHTTIVGVNITYTHNHYSITSDPGLKVDVEGGMTSYKYNWIINKLQSGIDDALANPDSIK